MPKSTVPADAGDRVGQAEPLATVVRTANPLRSASKKAVRRKAKAKRSHLVRVPFALYEQLVRLAEEIGLAKEMGRGYADVPFTEQGARGTWVPLAAVIARALNDFEKHRERSANKTANPPQRIEKPK